MEDDGSDVESNNGQSSLKENEASFFETVFNGLNAIIGTGVVIVPYALASGGWLSLILMLIISIAATYGGILTKRCMDVDPRIKTYSNIGEYAFGKIGKLVTSIILYLNLYMIDTSYLILEGDNLHKLFPKVAISVRGLSINGKSSFVLAVALVLLPTVWLDNLSILAYISATNVLAALLILGSVISLGAFDGIGFHSKGALLHWKRLPAAVSLYMVCFGANPVFPTIYTSMKKKRHFSKVIVICFSITTIIYVAMAVSGYLMFGSSMKPQITLSLPTHNISSQIAIYTTLVTPLAKYPLLLKPVVICTEGWFPTKYQKNLFFKLLIRTILVATQVIIALSFPYFEYVTSLVGALLSSTASLAMPCLCYLKISGINSKWRVVERIFLWVIVILSLLIVIFGSYATLRDIIREVMH